MYAFVLFLLLAMAKHGMLQNRKKLALQSSVFVGKGASVSEPKVLVSALVSLQIHNSSLSRPESHASHPLSTSLCLCPELCSWAVWSDAR